MPKEIKETDPVLYLAVYHWLDAYTCREGDEKIEKQGGIRILETGFVKTYNKKVLVTTTEYGEEEGIEWRGVNIVPAKMLLNIMFYPVGNKKEIFNARSKE